MMMEGGGPKELAGFEWLLPEDGFSSSRRRVIGNARRKSSSRSPLNHNLLHLQLNSPGGETGPPREIVHMVAPFFGWRSYSSCVLAAFCVLLPFCKTGEASVGVVYGTGYDSLSSTDTAFQLLSDGVTKVRLLNADGAVLQGFAKTGIEMIVGVLNEEIKVIGESKTTAFSWVQRYILAHIPATNITAIAVGSEIITSDPHLAAYLVPACWNIHKALRHFGLDTSIKVSAPQSMLLLESRFPPSSGRFSSFYTSSILQPFLNFLRESGSFFMVNVYPVHFYFSLTQVDVNFSLLQPSQGFDDPKTSLHYSNIFDALVDTLITAMVALDYSDIEVVVTETGWLSSRNQVVQGKASENAATYVSNLKAHLLSGIGTPLKPGVEIFTFLKRVLNEDDLLAPAYPEQFQSNGPRDKSLEIRESGQVRVDSSYDKSWCVGKKYADVNDLQGALDWACGPGAADCSRIKLGNPCFIPNTVYSHASYAFNSYYQIHQQASGTCDFGGTATITNEDPSYPGCNYPFRAGQVGAPIGRASVDVYHVRGWLTTLLLLIQFL